MNQIVASDMSTEANTGVTMKKQFLVASRVWWFLP